MKFGLVSVDVVFIVLSVLEIGHTLTTTLDSCFDLEGGQTYTGTDCTVPANSADVLVVASTPAPLHASLEAADMTSQILCFYTKMPAPTSLADMPTVLPDASDCSDGNSGVGWTKLIVKNPGMANVGVYFKDNNVPPNGWKMWVIQSNNQLDYELEALPPPPPPPTTPVPTAIPTEIPTATPTEIPTQSPTSSPTESPTLAPLPSPTVKPSLADVCGSWNDNQLRFDIKIIKGIATITLEGPSTAWIGVGFGSDMSSTYSITYHDLVFEELVLSTNGVSNVPVTQSTLTYKEEVANGRRKLVCTRPYDDAPYTLPMTGGMDVIIACGKCSSSAKTMQFGNHGAKDRKHVLVPFTSCPEDTAIPTGTPTTSPKTPSPNSTPSPASTPTDPPLSSTPEEDGGLSTIVIVLIILGVVVVFCAIAIFAFLHSKKGKDKKKGKKNNNGKKEPSTLDKELGEPLLPGGEQEMQEAEEKKVGINETEKVEEYEDVGADDLSTVDSTSVSSSKMATTVTSKSEIVRASDHALSDLESSIHDSFSHNDDHYQEDQISTPMASPSIDYREDPELQQLRQELRDKNHQLAKAQTSNVRFDRQLMSLDDQLLAACAAKRLPVPQRKGGLAPPTIDVDDL
eukprot:TRINITY_DN4381_c0_g1_i1.p1 TRINITY_DN4381_c0_g1~~TRINITY_DN4381_c0_g1_i1.p1  ORF type:complete len:627 (+),score=144.93 TRINITY_DN4381_c0_g1_i1:107-1987(+)